MSRFEKTRFPSSTNFETKLEALPIISMFTATAVGAVSRIKREKNGRTKKKGIPIETG